MARTTLYAISYEDNEDGCVVKVLDCFTEAVYRATVLFAEILPYEEDPTRFLEVCADPDTLVRVDVFECDSEDDADEKFCDALFTPLFHLDNGMNFRG